MEECILVYIKLFSKKFIVSGIAEYKDDEQCGKKSYDVEIIIDSKRAQGLTIGLTHEGKICFIWDEINDLYEHDIKTLKASSEYKDLWL